MKLRPLALFALLIAAVLPAYAGLAGKWTAEFDTQIGRQKYAYEFKQDADQITGTANYEHSFGKGTVTLKSVKVDGDKVSFTEALSFNGNELTITYQGTLAGDELKLTRQVGDIATEQLTASRVPAQK
ncbi:MAG TPA: hypothetical protein VIM71_14425 [Lacunisphaera sp.]